MKAILVKTSNEVVIGDFTFGQMQKQFKSGYAEIIKPAKLQHKYFMVVDEEGLLNESPLNKVGSHIFGHKIVGDIFLCGVRTIFLYGVRTHDLGSLSEKGVQELKVMIDEIIAKGE